jgi:hypothetical protein
MSEETPGPDVQSAPPVQAYANYPRTTAPSLRYSSPEKLQALMEGYYGLNWAFLAMVVLGILALVGLIASQESPIGIGIFIFLLAAALVAAGMISYPYNKKIGYGLGWKESTALWVSVGFSVGSCVTSPIIVFIVLQLITMMEIKNHGVKGGFFGVRKRDIKAKIEELKQSQNETGYSIPSGEKGVHLGMG